MLSPHAKMARGPLASAQLAGAARLQALLVSARQLRELNRRCAMRAAAARRACGRTRSTCAIASRRADAADDAECAIQFQHTPLFAQPSIVRRLSPAMSARPSPPRQPSATPGAAATMPGAPPMTPRRHVSTRYARAPAAICAAQRAARVLREAAQRYTITLRARKQSRRHARYSVAISLTTFSGDSVRRLRAYRLSTAAAAHHRSSPNTTKQYADGHVSLLRPALLEIGRPFAPIAHDARQPL